MSTGSAPDGSPVLLYRRLPARDEPEIVHAAAPAGCDILELGAGAGRVTHPLVRLGHRVVAVDESAEMLRWVHGAETVVAQAEGLDLGRAFEAVVLGSHLVNTPDNEQRAALLATCRRHVSKNGVVLIEHHPPDWAETATDSRSEVEGIGLGLEEVRRQPPFVSAVAVYELDGQTFRQRFTARVLSAAELARELESAGLRTRRQINSRWTEAVPMA